MKTSKKLLITGGSGYLGRHLTARAIDSFHVLSTYSAHADQIKAGQAYPLNLTDREQVLGLIADLKPQAIIHTAALNPGRGTDQEMSQVNALGSRYVAEAAMLIGARLVHVSSDVVHSGKNAPYADEAPPTPINGYGRSKAQAEAAVAEIDPTAAIVRTSLIYGLVEMDRGTAGFVKRLHSGQPLILFSDVIRQPVWVETLAEALLKLVELDYAGTLNVVGSQALTRQEFGQRLLAWWGIEPGDLLHTGRAADISDTTPLDLRLTITKAQQLLQMAFPGVDDVLDRSLPL
jgi:dTDP-4-dehydrorhamnose reductase